MGRWSNEDFSIRVLNIYKWYILIQLAETGLEQMKVTSPISTHMLWKKHRK